MAEKTHAIVIGWLGTAVLSEGCVCAVVSTSVLRGPKVAAKVTRRGMGAQEELRTHTHDTTILMYF